MSQITSFRTREVRWFINHPCAEISNWFDKLPLVEHTRESREDIYLVLPGRKDLGIKFRESRLELKYRLGDPQSGSIGSGITGSFESWEKLGFQSNPEISSAPLPEGSKACRVPVRKQRLATQVEQTGTAVKCHPLETEVQNSVQLEYTRLHVFGSYWYTVGLEWPYIQGISLPAGLLSGLLPATLFDLKSSMGYPEFLQGLLRPKEGA